MTLPYRKKKLKSNLFMGIIWLVFGVLTATIDKFGWAESGWLFLGALYIGNYLFMKFRGYATIDKNVVHKNSLFQKKIALNEITRIKKFTGDYIIQAGTKEITIDTHCISEDSIERLNEVLASVNLPADKTPFARPTQD